MEKYYVMQVCIMYTLLTYSIKRVNHRSSNARHVAWVGEKRNALTLLVINEKGRDHFRYREVHKDNIKRILQERVKWVWARFNWGRTLFSSGLFWTGSEPHTGAETVNELDDSQFLKNSATLSYGIWRRCRVKGLVTCQSSTHPYYHKDGARNATLSHWDPSVPYCSRY